MEKSQETLRVTTAFVNMKYRGVAHAAGIRKREFGDWAQSMAGMGVALAWKKIDDYDSTRGSFVTYAIFKTKEVVRASLREHFRYSKAKDVLLDTFEPHPQKPEYYITREETLEVLKILNDDQRTAISLSYAGYDVNEIADIMGKESVNTVYSILRRARKKSLDTYRKLQQEPTTIQQSSTKKRPRKPRVPPDDPDEHHPVRYEL